MTRTTFLAWLLDLIRNAPAPTEVRELPETEEFDSGLEVTVGGATFRIAVEEVEA